MKNLQTLQDLANSAKASQDEFNNTLIEIHSRVPQKIGHRCAIFATA